MSEYYKAGPKQTVCFCSREQGSRGNSSERCGRKGSGPPFLVTESLSSSIIYLLPLSLLFVSFAATVTKGSPTLKFPKLMKFLEIS